MVDLRCAFYNVNHIYVFITIFAVNNLCFRIYPRLLLLSLTLFVDQFLSASASSHVWLTASFSSIFTFTQKSDYDITFIPKSNLTLSVTSINTLPVKLSTIIWGYVISFVNMSACLSDFERYIFYIIMVFCHLSLILVGPEVIVVRRSQQEGRGWKKLWN